MQISAAERGRRLVLTIGGPTPDMTDEEAAEAAEDVVRVSVPPLTARMGSRLFAFYAGIAFARQDSLDAVGFTGTPKEAVEHMTRMALGALELPDGDGGSEAQRVIARERWDHVQALRWDEAQTVCNAALFWNVQGGSLEAVQALLDESTNEDGTPAGGVPKAQELVLQANGLADALSRLTNSLVSGASRPTSSADTPSGSDENSPADETPPPDISETSTGPSESPTTKTTTSSSSPQSGSRAKSTRTSSGGSRSRSGTTSPPSTSTSGSGGTTKTTGSGTSAPGVSSPPASSD